MRKCTVLRAIILEKRVTLRKPSFLQLDCDLIEALLSLLHGISPQWQRIPRREGAKMTLEKLSQAKCRTTAIEALEAPIDHHIIY
jgi:hypothetical protein